MDIFRQVISSGMMPPTDPGIQLKGSTRETQLQNIIIILRRLLYESCACGFVMHMCLWPVEPWDGITLNGNSMAHPLQQVKP